MSPYNSVEMSHFHIISVLVVFVKDTVYMVLSLYSSV